MPSPLGHALGGALAGGLVAGAEPRTRWWRQAALLGVAGTLPDLDFLMGLHSQYSHSVGAALLVGLAVLVVARGGARLALAAAAAYASHILLDWLSLDTTAPIGVMALWPLSPKFYESDFHLFMAISRRYWLPGFVAHNLIALAWEVLLLGPPVALVWWRRSRRRSTRSTR